VSELDNQRRLRAEREKRKRRNGWYCLIAYCTITLIIGFYLGQGLNLFFQILLSILSVILLIIVYRYLIYNFFFKKKKRRISW